MEDIKSYLQGMKEFMDANLEKYLANDEPLLKELYESVNYTLFPGGKRTRPLFCFLVGEIFDVPSEKMVSLSCAVEMIHTASLIMDDLPHMDDGKIRRGKRANHLVYGQDVAALASIGLLTRAYQVVLTDPLLPDDIKSRVTARLAHAVGLEGMVGGQFMDVKFSDKSMEKSTLRFIHANKTASLFVASGAAAAIVGDASVEQISAIETYAYNLGFAFQVLDDILDFEGNVEDVHKTLRSDRGNFVTLYGIDKSKELVQQHTNDAVDALRIFEKKGEKLVALAQILLKRKA
jgi:geranylgeranyl diphosphate synthase type II